MNRAYLLLLLLSLPAAGGPPCVCWRIDIGDAKSLPWGEGDRERDRGYDARRAVEDALGLLGADMPVLVRMETTRRAVIYVGRDGASRDALLSALQARVLDAEALERPSALAWFDAGYAVECFRQNGDAGNRDGYPWVKRALGLSKGDGGIEFACALMSMGSDAFQGHLDRAETAGARDPLLHRNVAALRERLRG
jgi:hypothetical protein